MRKFVLLFFISFSFLAAQNVSVEKVERITDSDMEFYYPQFSPDGNELLLTSENYSGLWLYNLNENRVEELNDFNGAGYQAKFTNDGSSVIFRADEFDGLKKYSSLIMQNLQSKEKKTLKERSRHLTTAEVVNNKAVFLEDKNLQSVEVETNLNKTFNEEEISVLIEDQKIALVQNGEKKILSPLGDGNYVWASVSPDNAKLLFNFVGRGTFISDLDGNILNEIGYANAPKWSDDGKFIVYMKDYDDGQRFTDSEIYAYSLESGREFQLTDSEEEIEMYPVWDKNRVAYNTINGQIFVMELKID